MNWEEEYKRLVLDGIKSYGDINKFLQPYMPQYLYKYCDFNGEYWSGRLDKGELYFSPANKLNDLSEGYPKIDLKEALREGTKLNKSVKQGYGIPEKKKLNLNNEQVKEILGGFQEDIRIASLSEINNSDSMWDRYADKHKGFCIEYDVRKMSDLKRNMLYKVLYEKEKPDITNSVANLSDGAGLVSIIFKSNDWTSEKEWRMFKIHKCGTEKEAIKYYFRKEIKAVYLGMNCEEKNKSIIIEWAKKEKKEIYQMSNSYEKYELDSTRII